MMLILAFLVCGFIILFAEWLDTRVDYGELNKKLREFSTKFGVYVAMESEGEIMMCKGSTCVREPFYGMSLVDDQLAVMYQQIMEAIKIKESHGFKTDT